jgi:hypothetical protein
LADQRRDRELGHEARVGQRATFAATSRVLRNASARKPQAVCSMVASTMNSRSLIVRWLNAALPLMKIKTERHTRMTRDRDTFDMFNPRIRGRFAEDEDRDFDAKPTEVRKSNLIDLDMVLHAETHPGKSEQGAILRLR